MCTKNLCDLEAGRGYSRGAQARQKRLGDACNESLEAHNVENACEVVTERHQAQFAANLVEAAHQEVPVTGAAFESAEGMLHDGGAAAHQFVGAMHPCAMTFENIFVLPAGDDTCSFLSAETPCP